MGAREGATDALADAEPFRLLGRRVAPAFVVRVVLVGNGRQRAFDERDWRDALTVLERGGLELECECGTRRRFQSGAVLYLAGLPLRVLRQCGPDSALVVSVRRRCGPVSLA
jgi:hypothetical protein